MSDVLRAAAAWAMAHPAIHKVHARCYDRSVSSLESALTPRLVERTGPRAGHEHLLYAGQSTLGRGDGCEIDIASPDVSRRHALVELHDDGATIIDLGSKNGVEFDGAPLQAPLRLRDGQRIFVGGIELELVHPASRVRRVLDGAVEVTSTRTRPQPPAPAPPRPLWIPLVIAIAVGSALTLLFLR